MNDDDRPTLRIGDYVTDREDEDKMESNEATSVMLMVEFTLKPADAIFIDDGTTVADVNVARSWSL